MSAINGVVLAPGTKPYLLNDGTIRVTTDRFGTGAKIGGIRLPDFRKSTEMYTKTEPLRSDEEIKEDIAKMARKDAEKGQCCNQTKEWFDLKKEYMSSVSPDRESIITNSTKQIFATKNSFKSKNEEHAKTLLELLINEEKGNGKNSITNVNSTRHKACLEGDNLTYAEFYGSNGEIIATYDYNGGWAGILTKEEIARQREFTSTYSEAWNSANAEINIQNDKSIPKHVDGGTAIDAYA
jgi:hypothetical protein